MKGAKVVWLGLVLAAGCDLDMWSKPSCKLGEMSCKGRDVRVCVPDVEAAVTAEESVTKWSVQETCEDDEQLGPQTCRTVAGKASCASGTSGPTEDAPPAIGKSGRAETWLSVTVQRPDVDRRDGLSITTVEALQLASVPPAASSGMIAAVSYAGAKPIDAALVPLEPGATASTVLLWGEGVDRIALVASNGAVVNELAPDGRAANVEGVVGSVRQALSATLPSSVSVLDPRTDTRAQPDDSVTAALGPGSAMRPTPEMLSLVADAFGAVPASLATAVNGLAFLTDFEGYYELLSEPPSSLEESLVELEAAAERPRAAAKGTTLFVDFTKGRLAEYRRDASRLRLDVVRAVAQAYIYLASGSYGAALAFGFLNPADYPPEITKLLQRRVSALVAPGEKFKETWSSFHQIAVEAKLAVPYSEGLDDLYEVAEWAQLLPRDDATAVEAGFAALRGAREPLGDFAEYVARIAVPEQWPASPCGAIGAQKPLASLEPRLIVHLAKLEALAALELIDPQVFTACVGDLGVKESGFTFHRLNTNAITLVDELQGERQPYYDDDVTISASAQRKYLNATLSATYRGTLPTAFRILPVGQNKTLTTSATLALTNARQYTSAIALGGILAFTHVGEDYIEAHALLVKLQQPFFDDGGNVLPMITVRAEMPAWGEAP